MLRAKLEEQAKACADSCRVLVAAFIAKQQNVAESPVDELVKDVWDNHALLQNISRHEALIYRKKFNENFALKVSVISRSVEHLRNMVRAIVGTLLELGRGKLDLEGFRKIIEAKDRSKAGVSVPAEGLFLTKVEYPESLFPGK